MLSRITDRDLARFDEKRHGCLLASKVRSQAIKLQVRSNKEDMPGEGKSEKRIERQKERMGETEVERERESRAIPRY